MDMDMDILRQQVQLSSGMQSPHQVL